MNVLRNAADATRSTSLSHRFRSNRFRLFRSLMVSVPRPARILDVGGTAGFWRRMGFHDEDVDIVLVNTEAPAAPDGRFRFVQGDARDLSEFADDAFDVVFSNSVIEHVGDFDDQRRMAEEVRRVGRRWFVQTPNRYFPVEPHFLVPGFQFLPVAARARLLTRFDLGWIPRAPDLEVARQRVQEIRLLTRAELERLFPGSRIHTERVLGLAKSFVACGGWA
jgi:Methyltransferase domain